MFKRIIASWRSYRDAVQRIEAHLEAVAASAADTAARLDRLQDRAEISMIHMGYTKLYAERMEYMMAQMHPRFDSPLRLERYGAKTSSQNDEDGIIAEIFRRIGATARTFVEIAAGDGKENCTALLLRSGWSGLWVECAAENAASIRVLWADEIASGKLHLADTIITPSNVNDVINRSGIGEGIDLLVMDIDGNDYHVLEAMEARPRVICSEYFGRLPPPVEWVMPYSETFNPPMGPNPYGATLQSLTNMLTAKGYSLVGTSITGVNAFFVRSDLVADKFHTPFTARNHYNSARYWFPTVAPISAIWPGVVKDEAPGAPGTE